MAGTECRGRRGGKAWRHGTIEMALTFSKWHWHKIRWRNVEDAAALGQNQTIRIEKFCSNCALKTVLECLSEKQEKEVRNVKWKGGGVENEGECL